MLYFIIAIVILVFVHELGHYTLARWAGVHVEVFSVGFGPEIFGYTDKVGTRWRISLIPLGGYVRMMGSEVESPEQLKKRSPAELEKCYANKTVGQRALILLAGPLANFLFAILAVAALYSVQGKPEPGDFPEQGISVVVPGSPAYFAGFQVNDVVTAVDGVAISSYMDLSALIVGSQGRELTFDILRQGRAVSVQATPRWQPAKNGGQGRYFLGVGHPEIVYKGLSPLQSVGTAWGDIWRMTGVMIDGIGQIFVNDIPIEDQLAGPVRIAQLSSSAADIGLFNFIMFLSVLSLNLAIMNLLPIPLLDGGHLLFCAIEFIRGKPVARSTQEKALRIGFSILVAIMMLALWGDIKNLLNL